MCGDEMKIVKSLEARRKVDAEWRYWAEEVMIPTGPFVARDVTVA